MGYTRKIKDRNKYFYLKEIKNAKKYRYEKKFKKNKKKNSDDLIYRGAESLKHSDYRELQRYNTSCLNHKKVIQSIKKGFLIIINKNKRIIKALIRYSSHYYIVVFDKKLEVIKTLLPYTCCDYLSLVQQFIDKFSKNVLAV